MKINEEYITYCGQKAIVKYDRKCHKAWGWNSRPINNNTGDYFMDHELGKAPADPGTYEGDESKPLSPDSFPSKWCIRECERCVLSMPVKLRKW